MAQGKQKKPTVDEVISKAVIATRLSCAREPKDVFKATEKRLYAYPVLQAKIKDDEEMLEEIEQIRAAGTEQEHNPVHQERHPAGAGRNQGSCHARPESDH